jgi:hypothetical protein
MSEYTITQDADGWRVARGADPTGEHYPTREEALMAALEAARCSGSRVHLACVKTPTRDFVFLD